MYLKSKKLCIFTSKQHLKQGLDCIAHGEAFVVGTIVGDPVDAVDVGVGAVVGVGPPVGSSVGPPVGPLVGPTDGPLVGAFVGPLVGEEVGIDVEDGAVVGGAVVVVRLFLISDNPSSRSFVIFNIKFN